MASEPTQGKLDHFYLYWIAQIWYEMAVAGGWGAGLQAPDVTYNQNRLLKIWANAVYARSPGTLKAPDQNCTDNVYLYNIATNLNVACPTYTVGQGRPDQVYLYIIASCLYTFAVSGGVFPLYAAPNQGDTFNRLLLKIDSLSYEMEAGPFSTTCIPGFAAAHHAFSAGFSSGFY